MARWIRLYDPEEDTWFHYELDDQDRAVRQIELQGPYQRPTTAAALDEVLQLRDHHGPAELKAYERRFGVLAEGSLQGWQDADHAAQITRHEFEALWAQARQHLAPPGPNQPSATGSATLARALHDPTELPLRPLPDQVADLLVSLNSPARLAAHLRLVHDVACQIVDWIQRQHPQLDVDGDAVLFGAATHDIGKSLHPGELSGPGSTHEAAGRDLLLRHGIDDALARFAATHASWTDAGITLEDLLVSLADKVWKNKRVPDLEALVVTHLAQATGRPLWEEYAALDERLTHIGDTADQRLAIQAAYPIHG
ncbi:HD domain-containing protein [Actinomadura monticuli]|uniref:HD domain-containing protein n=1 Tax=Actinomadura monticuli TaxID=3097367 RepID=A0ABV4QPQ0_9ACTN